MSADENLNRGATYVDRVLADRDVETFSRFGIVSEVVEDGRYWRVIVHPGNPTIENRLRRGPEARTA